MEVKINNMPHKSTIGIPKFGPGRGRGKGLLRRRPIRSTRGKKAPLKTSIR